MNSRGRGRSGRSGRGNGRGRGRGGRGRGRGGRGRSGSRYNPYSMTAPLGDNFRAEAKVYTSDEWSSMSAHQRQQVQDLKIQDGWVNGSTPPPGCVLDQHGYASASNTLVAAIRRTMIGATSTTGSTAPPLPPPPSPHTSFGIPPPPPSATSPVPPIINTNAQNAGSSFGRHGTRVPASSSDSVSHVSAVTINGQSYNGPVYDANNNRIA